MRVKNGNLQLASGALEAPERRYDADFATVSVAERVACFTFGKRSVNDPARLRTRLQIRMGEDAFLKYFWLPSVSFRDALRAFLQLHGPISDHAGGTWQADADHSDWANVCSMAHAGQYAVLDFHELSPSGLARFSKHQDPSGLDVRAVVRIQLSAMQLVGLLDAAEAFVPDIQGRVHLEPGELEEEE